MIYLTKGIKQSEYNVYKETNGDFYNLVELTRKPQQAFNQSAEQLAEYKQNTSVYAIYGNIKGMKRKDEVINRTILFIDVDDESNYSEASKRIDDLLESFDINHVVYPTISNGIKEGARLRVGVELDRPVNADDYLKLWSVLLVSVRLHGDPTAVNHSFKQLQGLFVQTEQNSDNRPIIYDTGHGLPVDEFIKLYDANTNKYKIQKRVVHTDDEDESYLPRWAITNRLMLNTIMDPESNFQRFGGWDNMLTALGGWVFKDTQNFVTTAGIVEYVNNKGSDPIEESELVNKFKTWAKGWH
ncbi:hypothetical protein FKV75_02655 [Weissella paramesenteroides]|uniref:hypothetical protein n=1 Tax=Weissella paramesenteroides TaxID=1249 RepID=UPI00123BA6B8|nr:hypothetical protein [Weissella paramesenteroides]KAA8439192.1 hypothetical protein FKV81_08910 [Weissella paramesenteroides]KAA8440102.1 hypothetical protein FKV77_08550 [Weissella paramesenteroides]KAA8443989.1 hypothetical protein FKV75_02655 [Weissella paramesenteroides]KAA8446470.1 hypothetical protein FKV76_06265 [Weissella paramesenteroides]KAA8451539.1 hypothetical protein FKV74_02650 [Weissella paramesenteroides]